MSATIAVALRHATDLFGNLMGQRLLLVTMLFSFAWNPTQVMASFAALSPTLTVVVLNAPDNYGDLTFPTFSATVRPIVPYVFRANLELPGALLLKGDLYFGFIPPGGNKIFTWTVDGGTLSLKEGLVPVARGIDMNIKSSIGVSTILGRDIEYAFTGGDPPGMYLIVALFVYSDSDPFDERNWVDIKMVPLVFRP